MNAATQLSVSTRNHTDAGPFLKWAGGKGQILSQLESHFPKSFNRYFEPFLGSAAVFFHLVRQNAVQSATLTDVNAELINCFKVIRDDVDSLIPQLRTHEKKHDAKYYYRIRATDPNGISELGRAARFIYLNKSCYNGLYRVNSRGEFNVPIGSYINPKIFDEDNLRAVGNALKGVSLSSGHFSTVLRDARAGDFVYFDPPYYTESSGFTGYAVASSGRASFNAVDQRMLRNVVDQLVERRCHVVISNSDTKFIRNLYVAYKQTGVLARRFINCNGSGRQPVKELVITGDDHR
jgi:DNA adenine methylase